MIRPIEKNINDDGTQSVEVICDFCNNYADYQQKEENGHIYHLCNYCYLEEYENYKEDAPVPSEWEFQHECNIEKL